MTTEKFNFEDFKDIILINPKDKKLLFHCSPIAGLTYLKPNKSMAYKNGKQECVFASYNLNSILFYGSKNHAGDFDGRYGINQNGQAYFREAYRDALKKVYKGEKCYIYIVDQKSSKFEEGQTGYGAEVVDGTGKAVKLLKCYEVDDIYELMKQFEKENLIHFSLYKNFTTEQLIENTEYQKMLLKRIDAFNPKNQNNGLVKKCLRDYEDAILEIQTAKSI